MGVYLQDGKITEFFFKSLDGPEGNGMLPAYHQGEFIVSQNLSHHFFNTFCSFFGRIFGWL